MKINQSSQPVAQPKQPCQDDIREYAYHLYQQSGSVPGNDLDNWLEATACLQANIPSHQSGTRLHHHVYGTRKNEPSLLTTEAKILAS